MENFEVKILMQEAFHKILPGMDFEALDLSLPLREHIGIDELDLQRVINRTTKKAGMSSFEPLAPEFRNLNDIINFISGQPGERLIQIPNI